MSSERKTLHVWTCDACGVVETMDGSGSDYPSGWFQVAAARLTARLGNITAKHLCAGCSDLLSLLLDHQLGDTGDLAQACNAD